MLQAEPVEYKLPSLLAELAAKVRSVIKLFTASDKEVGEKKSTEAPSRHGEPPLAPVCCRAHNW